MIRQRNHEGLCSENKKTDGFEWLSEVAFDAGFAVLFWSSILWKVLNSPVEGLVKPCDLECRSEADVKEGSDDAGAMKLLAIREPRRRVWEVWQAVEKEQRIEGENRFQLSCFYSVNSYLPIGPVYGNSEWFAYRMRFGLACSLSKS